MGFALLSEKWIVLISKDHEEEGILIDKQGTF
jgi:hypothetical protein